MKFSTVSLLAAAVATANGAAVTVTQHVHQENIVSVQGVVYVENGQTHTTYSVIGGQTGAAQAPAATTLPATTTPASTPTTTTPTTTTPTTTSTPTTTAASTTLDPTSAVPTSPASTKDTTTLTPTTSSSSSTSQQAATSSSSSSAPSGFASTILGAHNDKRALHKSTSPLSWSDDLASYAQAYADKYDCSGTLTHSGGPYGENLALGYDVAGSVNAWYGEIKDYDYSNPSFSSATGHFTQVVWKGSTQVGCGTKSCNNAWGNYVICSYSPAGNVIGQFPQNVQPLN